jgi:hypothetical protein
MKTLRVIGGIRHDATRTTAGPPSFKSSGLPASVPTLPGADITRLHPGDGQPGWLKPRLRGAADRVAEGVIIEAGAGA